MRPLKLQNKSGSTLSLKWTWMENLRFWRKEIFSLKNLMLAILFQITPHNPFFIQFLSVTVFFEETNKLDIYRRICPLQYKMWESGKIPLSTLVMWHYFFICNRILEKVLRQYGNLFHSLKFQMQDWIIVYMMLKRFWFPIIFSN